VIKREDRSIADTTGAPLGNIGGIDRLPEPNRYVRNLRPQVRASLRPSLLHQEHVAYDHHQ
jgi:hypothetical protein